MRVLVTGGTGSFGHAYVKRNLSDDIRVLSRDEEKQRAMWRPYIAELEDELKPVVKRQGKSKAAKRRLAAVK